MHHNGQGDCSSQTKPGVDFGYISHATYGYMCSSSLRIVFMCEFEFVCEFKWYLKKVEYKIVVNREKVLSFFFFKSRAGTCMIDARPGMVGSACDIPGSC